MILAAQVTFQASTGTICGNLEAGASVPPTKAVTVGVLNEGDMEKWTDVQSSWGYSFGANLFLGYQGSFNSSGKIGGPTVQSKECIARVSHRSQVPLLERLGFILWGFVLIGGAIGTFAVVFHKFSRAEFGTGEILVVAVGVVICGAIALLGLFLLKQALRRNR